MKRKRTKRPLAFDGKKGLTAEKRRVGGRIVNIKRSEWRLLCLSESERSREESEKRETRTAITVKITETEKRRKWR